MYVVVRATPFQRTTEFETKFVPFTIRVKAGPPTAADGGARLLMLGTGFVAPLSKFTRVKLSKE
jgi:hypothetical protein